MLKSSSSILVLILLHWTLGCSSFQTQGSSQGTVAGTTQAQSSPTPTVTTAAKPASVFDEELERHRRIWARRNIGSYDMTLSVIRSGVVSSLKSVFVEVRNGVATVREPALDVDEVRVLGYRRVNTVEKMFDILQDGRDNNATIKVKYNKEFGYPSRMAVNFQLSGSDHAFMLTIKKFEIVGS